MANAQEAMDWAKSTAATIPDELLVAWANDYSDAKGLSMESFLVGMYRGIKSMGLGKRIANPLILISPTVTIERFATTAAKMAGVETVIVNSVEEAKVFAEHMKPLTKK